MNKHDCLNYHIIKQKTRKTCNIFHKVFFPPLSPPANSICYNITAVLPLFSN